MHHDRHLLAQCAVSADATGNHQTLKAGLIQRTLTFDRQRIHHRIFKGAGDVSTGLSIIIIGADGISGKGFQAGEAEIQARTIGHRTREGKTSRRALLRHLRQHWPARIIQPKQLGRFVERFTRGIIDRFTQQRVFTNAGDANQLRMSARHQECDKRKFRRILFQHRRQQVAFHMVDRHGGDFPGKRQGAANGGTNQQRTDQSRACRVSHRVDLLGLQTGLFQRSLNQRHGFPHVIT